MPELHPRPLWSIESTISQSDFDLLRQDVGQPGRRLAQLMVRLDSGLVVEMQQPRLVWWRDVAPGLVEYRLEGLQVSRGPHE